MASKHGSILIANKRERTPWGVLAIIFLVSTVVRGLHVSYISEFLLFFDELAHTQLAKGLATGNGVFLRGMLYNYHEFLYSLVLAPVYILVKNTEIAHTVIVWLNAAMMSSAVFPGYLLARRFLEKKSHIWLITGSFLLCAEMMFAAFVIQENLNYPLMIWFFWAFSNVVLDGHTKTSHVCGLGIFLFILSICKQMNLSIVLGVALFLIIEFIVCTDKRRETAKTFALIFTSFIVLKVPYTLIMNAVSGNVSADSTIVPIIESVFNARSIICLIYPAILYVFFTIAATGLLPIPMIAGHWKNMSETHRRLATLIGCYIFVSIGAICVLTEQITDFNFVNVRYHSRYFFYSFPVIYLLFVAIIERSGEHDSSFNYTAVILGFVALLATLLPASPAGGALIDSASTAALGSLYPGEVFVLIQKCMMISVLLVGILLLCRRRYNYLTVYVSVLILINSIWAVVAFSNILRPIKVMTSSVRSDALRINDYLSDMEDSEEDLLLACDGFSSDGAFECYLRDAYRYTYMSTLQSYTGKEIDFSQMLYIVDGRLDHYDPSGTEPKYIICDSDISLTGYDEVNLGLKEYHLFERNGDKIYVERSANGISNDSWVETDPAELMIAGTAGCTSATLELTVDNWFMGHDMVVPYVDGTGYEGTLIIPYTDTPTEIEVPVYKNADSLAYQITITPSESMQPDGDSRYLSFQINSYSITNEQ